MSMSQKADQSQALEPIIQCALSLLQHKENNTIPSIVAIAGGTSVGKSYFAAEIATILRQAHNKRAKLLHCDDFLDPNHWDSDNFHPRLMHEVAHSVLQKIKAGETSIKKPTWKCIDGSWGKVEETFNVKKVDFIVAEGEFTLCKKAPYDFRKYADMGIFVDADDENLLQWNWARGRDVKNGQTQEEFFASTGGYLTRYRAFSQEANLKADFLVLKNSDHTYKIAERK